MNTFTLFYEHVYTLLLTRLHSFINTFTLFYEHVYTLLWSLDNKTSTTVCINEHRSRRAGNIFSTVSFL